MGTIGTSIVIKGADYSAKSVGNSFYPVFANLLEAKFFGSSIPDVAGAKKNKNLRSITSGPLTENSFGYTLTAGQGAKTGIYLPASRTVVALINPAGLTNAVRGFLGNNVDLLAAFSGREIVDISYQGGSGVLVRRHDGGTASNVNITPTKDAPFLLFDVTDATGMTRTLEAYVLGNKLTSSSAITVSPGANHELELGWSVGGSCAFNHVAAFNKALSDAERLATYKWVKDFYADKGVAI